MLLRKQIVRPNRCVIAYSIPYDRRDTRFGMWVWAGPSSKTEVNTALPHFLALMGAFGVNQVVRRVSSRKRSNAGRGQ